MVSPTSTTAAMVCTAQWNSWVDQPLGSKKVHRPWLSEALEALNGQYEASYDGKAPKACVEQLHFGLWGEERHRKS